MMFYFPSRKNKYYFTLGFISDKNNKKHNRQFYLLVKKITLSSINKNTKY